MSDQLSLVKLGEVPDAERWASLKINETADFLHFIGNEARKKTQFQTAETAFRRAIAMCPESGFLLSALGAVLWDRGRFIEALPVLERAVELWPDCPEPFFNLGQVCSALGKFDEAMAAFNRAIGMVPTDAGTKWNYAMSHLDAGRWAVGLELYDARFEFRGPVIYPRLKPPIWDGSDLNGKILYVSGEQGVGDRILFSRYLYWIKQTYPDVRIKCLISSPDLPPLEPLLWSYSEFVEFLPNGIPCPEADFGIYLISLAKHHGTMPDNVPPDPGLILRRCKPVAEHAITYESKQPAIKVGVAWAGNPGMSRNHDRCIPVEMLLELQENPQVQLFSLQFPPGSRELDKTGAKHLIKDLLPDMGAYGLVGQAGEILNMDLIITVCTSVAHLAGVLGVPCWVLLCADPYWIWGRGTEDSVWYPSVRLYRQTVQHDWQSVMKRVKVDLGEYAEELLTNGKQRNRNLAG